MAGIGPANLPINSEDKPFDVREAGEYTARVRLLGGHEAGRRFRLRIAAPDQNNSPIANGNPLNGSATTNPELIFHQTKPEQVEETKQQAEIQDLTRDVERLLGQHNLVGGCHVTQGQVPPNHDSAHHSALKDQNMTEKQIVTTPESAPESFQTGNGVKEGTDKDSDVNETKSMDEAKEAVKEHWDTETVSSRVAESVASTHSQTLPTTTVGSSRSSVHGVDLSMAYLPLKSRQGSIDAVLGKSTESLKPMSQRLGKSDTDLFALLHKARENEPKAELGGTLELQLGQYSQDSDLKHPTDVTINHRNNNIILCDSSHNLVKMYDCNGGFLSMIEIGQDPSSIIFSYGESAEEDRVFVKCKNQIHCIKLGKRAETEEKENWDGEVGKGKKAENWDEEEGSPTQLVADGEIGPSLGLRDLYGLAETDSKALVTLSSAREGTPMTEVVMVERSSGDLVRRFPLTPVAKSASLASKPRFIAAFANLLYVSDLGREKVYVISLETGEALREMGGPGRSVGAFRFVSGITLDRVGNLLVGDAKNNRIQAGGYLLVASRQFHVVNVYRISA